MGTPSCVNKRAGRKRVCSWFRSEYAHGQEERLWLCRVEDHEDIKKSDDGDDGQRRGANQRMTVMLLEETPAVLPLGKLFEGRKPQLAKKGKNIDCSISNNVPFVVPGLWTSSPTSSTPTSSTSSSQDSVFDVSRYTENPAPKEVEVRVSSYGKTRWKDQQEPKTQKNEGHEEAQSDLLHELPDWLQPRRTPAPKDRDTASSSHELPMESRAKVEPGSGKHCVQTHFPKDPNCDFCLKTKITWASCRRRAGTVVPRAEHFGDLITADHKILRKGCESRNNHRYAVVVQDLATQWIQSYPCRTKTSQETQKSLQKFSEPNRKPEVIYTDSSLEFGKACEDLSWNHCTSTPH